MKQSRIRTALTTVPQGRRGPKGSRLVTSLLDHGLTEDECWPWAGRRGTNGYGIAVIPASHARGTSAHRLVYTILVGPVPDGHTVDHRCHDPEVCKLGSGCPHRSCVNPDHLAAVTARENTLRSNSFASLNAAKTKCYQGHPFSPENTYVTPTGGRTCRTCQRGNWRRYDAAKRSA